MPSYLTLAIGEALPGGDGDEPDPVVVVLEPGAVPPRPVLDALATAVTVGGVGGVGGVVAVTARPVTDTLKIVAGDVVVGTADREHHRFVGAPFALRLGLLRRATAPSSVVGPAPATLTALAAYARLVPVPSG